MRKNRPLLFGACVMALLLGGCGTPSFHVMEAEKTRMPLVAERTVVVEALHGAPVIPSVSGRLLTPPPPVGTAVRAGDVLFEIDSSSYQAELATVRSKLASTQVVTVPEENDMARSLLDQGIITRAEYERIRGSRTTVTHVGPPPGLVESAHTLERMIAACTVRAPLDGTISEVFVGDTLLAAAGRPALAIRQNTPVVAETALPVVLDEVLKAGKNNGTLTVTLRGGDGKGLWYGELKKKPNDTGKSYTVYKIQADNPKGEIVVGGEYEAHIETKELMEGFLLPETALIKDDTVAIVTVDGLVDMRQVEVLSRKDGTMTVVGGIDEGDRVITNPDNTLEIGMKVKV